MTPVIRKQRILYLTSKSDLTRGGQRSLLQVLQRLDRSKYSPYLVVPEPGSLSKEAFQLGIPIYDVKWPSFSPKNLIPVLKSLFRLRSIIQEIRPDLIHADQPRTAHFTSLVRHGAKLVMHLRVATPDGLSDWLLANESQILLSISRAVARRFSHLPSARRKLHVIYNGIDTNLFSPVTVKARLQLRQEYDLPRKNVLIGLLAGFVPIKGHDFIMDLWPSIAGECDDAFLLLAGDKPTAHRDRLQRRIEREGLESSVRIVSFVHHPERFIPALDLVILPSVEEGFGRVLIEAASCSIPVIASDIAGIDEAVEHGENGFLVSARDQGKWARAVAELVQDKELRKKMGKRGRVMVLRRFTIEQHINELYRLYDSLVD